MARQRRCRRTQWLRRIPPAAGSGAGRVHARLARLAIAAGAANAVETLLDEQPASIPALDIVVDDFELRGRKLGRLEIDAVNRGAGAVQREGGVREWRLNKLSLAVAGGAASRRRATGRRSRRRPPGPRSPERRRTVMNFKLDIADAGGLLVAPRHEGRGARAARAGMEGQVAWLGSPLSLDYPSHDRRLPRRRRSAASSSRPTRAWPSCSAC